MKIYDLVIIGAGPAGLTAGLYAARSGLKTMVASKDIGGTTNSILKLENWPGFVGPGSKLMKQFYDQVKEYDVDFNMNEIIEIKKEGKKFILKTKKETFECKAIILATGTSRRKLNLAREKELTGKGVSYCVTCDAFFFKDKTVGVIGGSDCAATSALALIDIVKKIHIFYRGEELTCEEINRERLKESKKVELHYNSLPKKLLGEKKVEGIEVDVNGTKKNFDLDGIFIEIGSEPLTNFVENLKLKMERGYLVVDDNMKTNVKGIFAAGDVTDQKLKQVIVAAGQGSIAAKSAYDYINKLQE